MLCYVMLCYTILYYINIIVVGCAQTAAAGGIVVACLFKDSFAVSFKRYANAALPFSQNREWLLW